MRRSGWGFRLPDGGMPRAVPATIGLEDGRGVFRSRILWAGCLLPIPPRPFTPAGSGARGAAGRAGSKRVLTVGRGLRRQQSRRAGSNHHDHQQERTGPKGNGHHSLRTTRKTNLHQSWGGKVWNKWRGTFPQSPAMQGSCPCRLKTPGLHPSWRSERLSAAKAADGVRLPMKRPWG